MKEAIVTNCERAFVQKAISEGIRLDGRASDECRKIIINFGSDWGCVQVSLGETRVFAQVSCEVAQPKQTRPNEGLLNINVELSPMASPYFETGRQTEECIQINRLLEKALKDSRCVDLESLCIVAEEKVWALRVDVTVLNHEGNIMDCVSIAALTALAHFKRPDVTTTGEQITIHTLNDRDPLPIVLHHYPVSVTYAIFKENSTAVSDPSILEEKVADAHLVLGVNAYRELCGLHLGGSALADSSLVLSCANKSAARAVFVVQLIKEAILKDTEERAAGISVGFGNCIEHNKLTALAHERISIRLKKWDPERNFTDNKRPGNGLNKHFRFDDSADVSLNEDNVQTSIRAIDEGSAEILTTAVKFGEGGKNTWCVNKDDLSESDSSDDVEDVSLGDKKWIEQKMDTIEIVESDDESRSNKKSKRSSERKVEVLTIDSGDSSEEEVVMLEDEVIKIDITKEE